MELRRGIELVALRDGREQRIHLERTERGWAVRVGDDCFEVDHATVAPGVASLIVDGRQLEIGVGREPSRSPGTQAYRTSSRGGSGTVEIMDPLTFLAREARARSGGGGSETVTALMPGRVVKLLAVAGDEVAAGSGVVVLEAMKMENEIASENGGTLRRILVEPGQAVEAGDPLFEVG